jgi:hypothetical protein
MRILETELGIGYSIKAVGLLVKKNVLNEGSYQMFVGIIIMRISFYS